MAIRRTHEFLLDGDAQTYNRLGFRYTEGDAFVELLHPDSQHGEQAVQVPFEDFTDLAGFAADVLPIFEATKMDDPA